MTRYKERERERERERRGNKDINRKMTIDDV